MSKALKLAKFIHESGRQLKDAMRKGLTVQEDTLFRHALLLLQKPLLSPYTSWSHCEAVASALDAGGILDEPTALHSRHRMAFSSDSKTVRAKLAAADDFVRADYLTFIGSDDIAAASICHQPFSALQECSIQDLLRSSKGVPRAGYFIKAQIIGPPFQLGSIQCLVEDSEGTVIPLALYNFVALYGKEDTVADIAPLGASIKIKQPYVKVSNRGTLTLRVDNPCNVVIERTEAAIDPTFAKVVDRLHTTLYANTTRFASEHVTEPTPLDEEVAARQREGKYDFRTMPHDPRLQDNVANYFGPIVVRQAGPKGRGLFVTRNVKKDDLLFTEKAIGYLFSDKVTLPTASTSEKISPIELQTELTILANKDPTVNAQLSYLVHDASPNAVIPRIDWFRTNSFPPVETLSAKRIAGAVELNCFGSSKTKDGTSFLEISLFTIHSFMNHRSLVNTAVQHLGKVAFVYAARDLKAGEELTISYSNNKEVLREKWGVQAESTYKRTRNR